MGVAESIFNLRPMAGVDSEYLSDVQRGFGSYGMSGDTELAFLMVIVLVALIAFLLLLRALFRPSKYSLTSSRVDEIKDPEIIRKIIEKSATLRSVYDIEVFDPAYKEIYKAPVLGLNEENDIEVEMPSYLDPNLDFRDMEVRVNFRMSRRGNEEFYQFDTMTRFIGVTRLFGQRERTLRLIMPQVVDIGQKRRHLRVRPMGQFAFGADLLTPVSPANPIPYSDFRLLHEAEVRDLSIGGIQVVVEGTAGDIKVHPGDEVYLHFTLPRGDMNVRDLPRNYFAKGQVISVVREVAGRRVMTREADEMSIAPYRIRLQFTGKGVYHHKERHVAFRPATTLAFEDLSRWVQAYQRYRIQEERGLRPQPLSAPNVYTAKPPKVKPKYPNQPLPRKAVKKR